MVKLWGALLYSLDTGFFFSFFGMALDRLFHAWLNCFTLLKLGMADICDLGLLLVCFKTQVQ